MTKDAVWLLWRSVWLSVASMGWKMAVWVTSGGRIDIPISADQLLCIAVGEGTRVCACRELIQVKNGGLKASADGVKTSRF